MSTRKYKTYLGHLSDVILCTCYGRHILDIYVYIYDTPMEYYDPGASYSICRCSEYLLRRQKQRIVNLTITYYNNNNDLL